MIASPNEMANIKDQDASGEDDSRAKPYTSKSSSLLTTIKWILIYAALYFGGIAAFLTIIAEPFTMSTYFSDNSLLPGMANREFSLVTEAEYYTSTLEKLTTTNGSEDSPKHGSLTSFPAVTRFIKHELDNFGLETYEQHFRYMRDGQQHRGINLYSIIRGERSTSSESITLCSPFRLTEHGDTLSSVALTLALAKYFSTKSYWAKDVIILFVDHDNYGLSAWLDSYFDVRFRQDLKGLSHSNNDLHYDPLPDRSGPMQAAIVLELTGKQFSRINIKIQGMYGQLPNLDLFNLVVELAARESVTPYFHDKSLPYGISSDSMLYKHHLETAISFVKTQATMQSDGLHGLFLRHAIQSLTIEGPEHDANNQNVFLVSLLSVGRLIEGVFRSLNNLSERFNRSYYFYILVSLRRFTSIGYYMCPMGLLIAPLLLKAYMIHRQKVEINKFIGLRAIILLTTALAISVVSTFNISTALVLALVAAPILLII